MTLLTLTSRRSSMELDANSPVPVREQTVNALREAILSFELKPGQRLIEREFIERLGISRTTFREAIREVAAEGLVTVVPQKGARVSTPSFTEAVDLYEIRACLESLAVMRFVERASDEEISALEEAIVDFSRVAHKTTDTLALLNSKEMFYRVLIVGARSPVLEQLLAQMKARVRGLRAASLSKPGRAFETVDELDAVVRAIRDRNAELAANLCAEHVRTAAKIALRRLQDSVETDEVQYA